MKGQGGPRGSINKVVDRGKNIKDVARGLHGKNPTTTRSTTSAKRISARDKGTCREDVFGIWLFVNNVGQSFANIS